MYSRRTASGGEQSDVHFCTCRARCRTSKLPAAQTAACLECVKGNPAVGDKLADEVMNLLMSLRAPRQALGGVARVWGVPPTSSSNPPHTTTQPPNPPPRDPSVEQSPPSDAHPNCRAPALAEETKEKKSLVDQTPGVAYQASI